MTPSPTRLDRELNPNDMREVDEHRDTCCERYESCLVHAGRLSWPSWSCRGCPVGALAHLSPRNLSRSPRPKQPGPPPGQARPHIRARILALLAGSDRGWTATEMAVAINRDGGLPIERYDVAKAMSALVASGRVERTAPGVYARWESE